MKTKKRFSSLTSFFSISNYFKIRSVLRSFKPDIIHAHNISRVISPSFFLLKKRFNVPLVMTVHDFSYCCAKSWAIQKNNSPCPGFSIKCIARCRGKYDGALSYPYYFLRYVKMSFHRYMIRKYVDFFIFPSHALKSMMSNSLNISPDSSVVVPNFVKTSAVFKRRTHLKNNFLFVGRITKEKGLDVLIEALDDCVRNGPQNLRISLIVVGDGPLKDHYVSLVEKKRLSAYVRFIGKLPNKEIMKYYRDAKATVLPSIWMENNPLVCFESLQNGCPVICSDVGGLPDIIKDRYNGLLFPAGDYLSLSKCLQNLMLDDLLVKTLNKNARHSVRMFSSVQYEKSLYHVYNDVLDTR